MPAAGILTARLSIADLFDRSAFRAFDLVEASFNAVPAGEAETSGTAPLIDLILELGRSMEASLAVERDPFRNSSCPRVATRSAAGN